MAEQVSTPPMYPHLRRFLIRWIRDQIEGVPRFDVFQVLIPVREGDAMNRGSEIGWPTIRERRS